jgi:hypothetical protein
MKRYNMSTRVLGAFAVLSLAPAAFAQTAQDPASNDPNNPGTVEEEHNVPSGDSYGQQPSNEARVPEMTDHGQTSGTRRTTTTTQKSTTSTTGATASDTKQPRAIDPSEVQQVFGQQASVVDIKSLSADEAKNLQQRLKDLGYYQGEIDGLPGAKTKAALNGLVRSQFVLTQRMVEQGQMPSQLVSSLGLRPDIMPTSGTMNQGTGNAQPQTGTMQPRTTPPANAQQRMNQSSPPASYDAPPANQNDSPRSPSGPAPAQQQQTAPKR